MPLICYQTPDKGQSLGIRIQGLSERMAFLKLLVLGNESTIGAQICGKISIKGRHF